MRKWTVVELCKGLALATWDENVQFKEPVTMEKWVTAQQYCSIGNTVSCQTDVIVGLYLDSFKCFLHRYYIKSILTTAACFQKMGTFKPC